MGGRILYKFLAALIAAMSKKKDASAKKGVCVPIKGLGFCKQTSEECELCQLKRTTDWYDDSNSHFVVIECDQCDYPMAVLLSHAMQIDADIYQKMEVALVRV